MTALRTIVTKAISDAVTSSQPFAYEDAPDAVLSALAAPANRDALAAWLVEVGVLTRPIMITPDSDDHPVSDGCYVMPEAMARSDDHRMAAHDWQPLYRIGGAR